MLRNNDPLDPVVTDMMLASIVTDTDLLVGDRIRRGDCTPPELLLSGETKEVGDIYYGGLL